MRNRRSMPSLASASAASVLIACWMSSAARQARKAWSSRATGAPNKAMMPSPVNLSTVPPYRCTTAADRLNTAAMMSRSRSGSRLAARSIERTTSANSTVTCLYSADAEGLAIAAPQPSQNRAPRRGSVPQVPQTRSVPPMRCDLPRSRMASGAVAPRLVHASGNITVRRVRRACLRAVRRRRRLRPRTCRAGRTAPR